MGFLMNCGTVTLVPRHQCQFESVIFQTHTSVPRKKCPNGRSPGSENGCHILCGTNVCIKRSCRLLILPYLEPF